MLAILNEHMSVPTVHMCIHVHDCWVRLVNVIGEPDNRGLNNQGSTVYPIHRHSTKCSVTS